MAFRTSKMLTLSTMLILSIALSAGSAFALDLTFSNGTGGATLRTKNPKISTSLVNVINQYDDWTPEFKSTKVGYAGFLKHKQYLVSSNRTIQVYIWLSDWSTESLQAVMDAGVEWTVDDPDRMIIQSFVSMESIDSIADLSVVRAITLPSYPLFDTGFVETQGDALQKTADVRELYGVSGAGVKIGVISDGFADGTIFDPPIDVFKSCTDGITVTSETTDIPTITYLDPTTCDLPPVIAQLSQPVEEPLDPCIDYVVDGYDRITTLPACCFPPPPEEVEPPPPGEPKAGPGDAYAGPTLQRISDPLDEFVSPGFISPGCVDGSFGKVFYRSFVDPNLVVAEYSEYRTTEYTANTESLQVPLITIGSEGTAMMEIIHDVAPDAQLYFSNFLTTVEFDQSKDWLASMGCDIICDDISVLPEGPLDGTSPSSMKNASLTQDGYAYVTSVGNYAEVHYRGRFQDDPTQPNGVHNFANSTVSSPTGDETMDFYITGGADVVVSLVWQEEWGEAQEDYDLFLLDSDNLDLNNPVAFSVDFQGTSQGLNNPSELIAWSNNRGGGIYSLVIARKDRKPTLRPGKMMDMFFFGGFRTGEIEFLERKYMTPSGSVLNNSDAAGDVISVGAIDQHGANAGQFLLEPFSSFGPLWDQRRKPELCSFDGVNCLTKGFEVFYGTSAAAPHVAGAIALMKELYPEMTPAQARSYLQAFCNDMYAGKSFPSLGISDATGPDDLTGAGYIDMARVFEFVNNLKLSSFQSATKYYSFDDSADGWITQSLEDLGFAAPEFSSGSFYLLMKGQGDLSFGSWISPLIEFSDYRHPGYDRSALLADTAYVMRANISTDAPDDQFVTFRMRLSNYRNESVAESMYVSMDGNTIAPGASGRDYYIYFVPDSVDLLDGLFAAVDFMNFDSNNALSSGIYINEVEITELHLNVPEEEEP